MQYNKFGIIEKHMFGVLNLPLESRHKYYLSIVVTTQDKHYLVARGLLGLRVTELRMISKYQDLLITFGLVK